MRQEKIALLIYGLPGSGKGTQADLAAKLGLHPTYISQVERGVRNMALKNIEKVARALGVRPDKLLR